MKAIIIAEQYADWGVHFEPNVFAGTNYTGDPFADNTDMTATATDFGFNPGVPPPVSGNLLQSFSGWLQEDGAPTFWLRFDQPVIDFSLDAYAGGTYTIDGASAFSVYGFDADLNLLTATPTDLRILDFQHIGLPTVIPDGYSYVGITGDFSGWTAVDNLQFTTVPEPGSFALVAGIAVSSGLFLRRRKRACR